MNHDAAFEASRHGERGVHLDVAPDLGPPQMRNEGTQLEAVQALHARIRDYVCSAHALPLFLSGPSGVGKTTCVASLASSLSRPLLAFQPSNPTLRFGAHSDGMRALALAPCRVPGFAPLHGCAEEGAVVLIENAEYLPGGLTGAAMLGLVSLANARDSQSLRHHLSLSCDPDKVLFAFTSRALPSHNYHRKVAAFELHGYSLGEKTEMLRRFLESRGVRVDSRRIRSLVLSFSAGPGLDDILDALASRGELAACDLEQLLENSLGPSRLRSAMPWRSPKPGEAVGLACTLAGGIPLVVEAAIGQSARSDVEMLSSVGEAVASSAQIALHLVNGSIRENESRLGIRWGRPVWMNFPSTPLPIDGRSAGLAMAAALYGLATGRAPRAQWAFSGQLSLSGLVLPVSGCPAKLLAAEREGLAGAVLPEANEAEALAVRSRLRSDFELRFVRTYEGFIAACFD